MRKTLATAVAATVAVLAVPGSAQADGRAGVRTVEAQDECDPVTFTQVLGPGACTGDGDTTFAELVAQLTTTGTAPDWRFHSDHPTVRAGEVLRVEGDGGEFHTFTEVAAFGGGCVDAVNALVGLTPVPECAAEAAPGIPLAFVTTGVAPGDHHDVTGLTAGRHLFECLVHPWMRAVVTVRP